MPNGSPGPTTTNNDAALAELTTLPRQHPKGAPGTPRSRTAKRANGRRAAPSASGVVVGTPKKDPPSALRVPRAP